MSSAEHHQLEMMLWWEARWKQNWLTLCVSVTSNNLQTISMLIKNTKKKSSSVNMDLVETTLGLREAPCGKHCFRLVYSLQVPLRVPLHACNTHFCNTADIFTGIFDNNIFAMWSKSLMFYKQKLGPGLFQILMFMMFRQEKYQRLNDC